MASAQPPDRERGAATRTVGSVRLDRV